MNKEEEEVNAKSGAQEAEEGRAKQVVLQLEQEARYSSSSSSLLSSLKLSDTHVDEL